MQQPINYAQIAPEGLKAMLGLETYVRRSGIDHGLLELVKTRVSQINRCAFCIDMHTKDASGVAPIKSDTMQPAVCG